MQFRSSIVTNRRTRAEARVWLPEPESADQQPDRAAEVVDISLGGHRRVVAAHPLRTAAEFNMDARRRTQLGHDCAIFALACVTGDSFRNQRFNQAGGLVVKIGALTYSSFPPEAQLMEPEIEPGEVAFTANADPDDADFFKVEPHLLVRASVDEGSPLYFSKLGTDGPVILSELGQVMDFYPTKTVGVADDLHAESFALDPPLQ